MSTSKYMPWYVLNENILYVLSLQEVHIQNVQQQFTEDLNTSHADALTTKPLGPGRGTEDKLHKQHCLEASVKFQLNWNIG